MNKPSTISDLRTELAEIDKKIAELRSLTARRERLLNVIRQWEALYAGPHPRKQRRTEAVSSVSEVPDSTTHTTGFAIMALSKKGPLTLDELMQEARSAGWVCSGNNLVDKKRLYAAMYTKSKVFSKGEDGKWKLIEAKAKAS